MNLSGHALVHQLVTQVEQVLEQAALVTRPPEVDPYRGELFELFARAWHGALLRDEASPDLTSDTLCRLLAERWGLDTATRASVQQQTKLSPEDLTRMRSLWSVMRMWMEWEYAWTRFAEFHAVPE